MSEPKTLWVAKAFQEVPKTPSLGQVLTGIFFLVFPVFTLFSSNNKVNFFGIHSCNSTELNCNVISLILTIPFSLIGVHLIFPSLFFNFFQTKIYYHLTDEHFVFNAVSILGNKSQHLSVAEIDDVAKIPISNGYCLELQQGPRRTIQTWFGEVTINPGPPVHKVVGLSEREADQLLAALSTLGIRPSGRSPLDLPID